MRNLLKGIREDEKVISILPMARELIENPEGNYLIFATSQGRIKRSKLADYVRINRNGKYALKFATESDTLVQVRSATDADHVVLVSSGGYACRFLPADVKTRTDPNTGEVQTTHTVRVQGRVSQGVTGMKLAGGDNVIGFQQINTRLQRTAFLNAGLQIILRDFRTDDSVEIDPSSAESQCLRHRSNRRIGSLARFRCLR